MHRVEPVGDSVIAKRGAGSGRGLNLAAAGRATATLALCQPEIRPRARSGDVPPTVSSHGRKQQCRELGQGLSAVVGCGEGLSAPDDVAEA